VTSGLEEETAAAEAGWLPLLLGTAQSPELRGLRDQNHRVAFALISVARQRIIEAMMASAERDKGQ
jgi:hypothetical protein